MKISKIVVFAFVVISVSCSRTERGTADMQGYLMYECGNTDPLGGVNVSFVINGTTQLSTTTDGFGYFKLKGDWQQSVNNAQAFNSYLSIESNGQNGSGFGSIRLMSCPPDVFNDTIYLHNYTYAVLTVDIPTEFLGNEFDTLYVDYTSAEDRNGGRVFKSYAGPFGKNQILDTIPAQTSSHIGYDCERLMYSSACGYFLNNDDSYQNAFYPWVSGQPNNACGTYTNVYLKLDK